jgi:hypothetical protein
MAKDSGLRIRLEDPLKRRFLRACQDQDKSAAQVIREFMRRYVDRRTDTSQGELFPSGTARPAGRIKG